MTTTRRSLFQMLMAALFAKAVPQEPFRPVIGQDNAAPPEIKPGDVVRHRELGIGMTVQSTNIAVVWGQSGLVKTAACVWFTLERATWTHHVCEFAVNDLELAKPVDAARLAEYYKYGRPIGTGWSPSEYFERGRV